MTTSPVNPNLDSPDVLRAWIHPMLANLSGVSITVFGDFCLDAYWLLDTSAVERSLETGLPSRRVREQRYSLGGAGSVVANLSALGIGTIRVIGAAGDDVFGAKLIGLLQQEHAALDGWFTVPGLQTLVYAKPCVGAEEQSRIDFGAFNTYSDALRDRMLDALDSAATASDAVILNQQIPGGITNPAVVDRINAIIAAYPGKLFLVDSRHLAARYACASVKVNIREAAEILGEPDISTASADEALHMARRIQERLGRPCFVTRGEHGMIAVDQQGAALSIPGIRTTEATDTVGAGDAVVASIAAAMAGGESAHRAAQLANIVASITVRQLQRTGTASAQQVFDALDHLEYLPQS